MAEHTAQDRFIEALGLISQTEGRPRISGQIIGYLIIAGEPRSLTQIAADLRVSKASISTNARELELLGMARRVAQLGNRQDLWEVAPRPNEQMLLQLSRRFRQNAMTIGAIADDFAPEDAESMSRVRELSEFYSQSSNFIDRWLAEVSARHSNYSATADED